MIPVSLQPEPQDFDALVRQPGLLFLGTQGVPPATSLAKGKKLPPHWRKQLKELHTRYNGICAYVGVYVELCTGGASVDHFVPKSKALMDAYDWDNYRLACTNINAKKNAIPGLLDPFAVGAGWFSLDVLSGAIGVGSVPGRGAPRLARRALRSAESCSLAVGGVCSGGV